MNTDKIIKQLSKKYKLEEKVVAAICKIPFEFIAERIRNADEKDIRLFYLGKFKMKNKYKHEKGDTNTDIPEEDVVD